MAELGGAAAIAAAPVLVAAGLLLGLFFATGQEGWGRANDVASAVFALLLVPVAVAADPGGAWAVFTVVGMTAMAVAAIASALTAVGRLTVSQLTAWQGGAFAVLFVWVGGVAAARLPDGVGWLGLAAAVLALVACVEIVRLVRSVGLAGLEQVGRPPAVATGASLAALVALPVWLVWLGRDLVGS